LPAAERTGKLTLITDAVVRHVTTNDKGLADGVFYFDASTKQSNEVKAKIVVLCASALESTRIMFNSANSQHPAGLGNSSGVVGHYLMDHIFMVGAYGAFPALNREPEAANRPNGVYIPRFRNFGNDKTDKFIRGYGYQGGENVTVWEHAYAMKGFGKDFKADVRDGNISRMGLSGFGEMLPRWENCVSLDKEKVDAWGIPVLHIECAHGDNEKAMAKDIVEQAVAMLDASGAENISTFETLAPPGFGIHECGTARMGIDPTKSALNKWNQCHDVKNLFVLDGAAFPSIACQNPTLTMMALTVRACEHMIEEHKRGNLA
jgi:choline dehydrogenase-like flavoprotein